MFYFNTALILITLMAAYSGSVAGTAHIQRFIGLTISACIAVGILFFLPFKQFFETYKPPGVLQIVLFTLAMALNYGWGIGYTYIQVGTFAQIRKSSMVYYFDFFCFLVPAIVFYLAFLQKWRDSQYAADTSAFIFGGISAAFGFALGAFMIWGVSTASGVSILAFVFLVGYFHALYHIYVNNNRSLP
jgi:hypothetical protein